MSYTQGDIDRLKKAMATGVRKLTYADGKSHEFFSMAEMRDQLTRMEREVAAATAGNDERFVVLTTQRGW